jgi:hypothetical protein
MTREQRQNKAKTEVLAAIAHVENSAASYQAVLDMKDRSKYQDRVNGRTAHENAIAAFAKQWKNVKILLTEEPASEDA